MEVKREAREGFLRILVPQYFYTMTYLSSPSQITGT